MMKDLTKGHNLHVRMTAQEKAYLDRACELDNFTSRSAFIRELITSYAIARIDKATMTDMEKSLAR